LKKTLAAAGVVGVLATAVLARSASADPTGSPTYRSLQGTGSDTTQGVLNGLSQVIKDNNGTKLIGSYDAGGNGASTTISTTPAANCQNITRPSGSGAGVQELVSAGTQGNQIEGCVNFARSSSDNSANYAGANLTYIPFAVDAVAYAVRNDGTVDRNLTTADLTAIYNCQVPTIHPLLPQFGSGTRQFFLKKLGFTDSTTFTSQPSHACISQTDANGNPLLENTGTLISDPAAIAPYAISSYLAQVNKTVSDVHGNVVLGAVDGKAATVLNSASSFNREVYNVVRNGDLVAGNPINTAFNGPTSQVCANGATIQAYGFATDPNCGSATLKTP